MGGFGIGRTGGTPTVEATASLTLDINRIMRLVKHALRARGLRSVPVGGQVETQPIPFRWTRRGGREPWAVVEVSLRLGTERGRRGCATTWDHHSRPIGPQDHTVRLDTTPCRFGGRRWWWCCPATGRRVAKLYLPDGGTWFLSRGPGAYRLDYQSQRGGWIDAAHGRAARIHRRLGGHCGHAFSATPPRPKRIRRTSYEPLVRELWDIQMAMDEALGMRLARADALTMKRSRRRR